MKISPFQLVTHVKNLGSQPSLLFFFFKNLTSNAWANPVFTHSNISRVQPLLTGATNLIQISITFCLDHCHSFAKNLPSGFPSHSWPPKPPCWPLLTLILPPYHSFPPTLALDILTSLLFLNLRDFAFALLPPVYTLLVFYMIHSLNFFWYFLKCHLSEVSSPHFKVNVPPTAYNSSYLPFLLNFCP